MHAVLSILVSSERLKESEHPRNPWKKVKETKLVVPCWFLKDYFWIGEWGRMGWGGGLGGAVLTPSSCFHSSFLTPHPPPPPHPPPARLWKLPSHRVSEVFFLRPHSICGIDSAGCLLKAPGRRLSAAVVPYWSCGVATEVGNGLQNPNTSSRHPATVTHTRLSTEQQPLGP